MAVTLVVIPQSARLGHSTVAFTLDVYTKAVPQLDREAAEQVARLIFGEGPPEPPFPGRER